MTLFFYIGFSLYCNELFPENSSPILCVEVSKVCLGKRSEAFLHKDTLKWFFLFLYKHYDGFKIYHIPNFRRLNFVGRILSDKTFIFWVLKRQRVYFCVLPLQEAWKCDFFCLFCWSINQFSAVLLWYFLPFLLASFPWKKNGTFFSFWKQIQRSPLSTAFLHSDTLSLYTCIFRILLIAQLDWQSCN